ncbi:hypothetical protein MATL_G00122570 [Megalops atlanticus]|uniref:Uncharacterized protein n=1 Tax=Megalops atlanticus TaxID=7932 RepID=A0A9D3PYX2_MEGAT|nr:hypothetical protein MATL_G00122570 [Megalops atlanticus]
MKDLPRETLTSSVAVAGAVIGAVLALFLIAVFTIVLLLPRGRSRPPAYTDKVIDLPPTHKPPPAYTERPMALPLAVSPTQVYPSSQAGRGDRKPRKVEPASARPQQRGDHRRPTHEPLTYQEWICHLSGADRVYINHREHYV